MLCRWLLNIRQVGIHDNCFTLGGHSLQATRLNSLIRDELSIEIPLRSIFEQLTLEKLSQTVTVCLVKEKRKKKTFPDRRRNDTRTIRR
ncbi:phosphopantetheine-binding protein [Xenorhabdus sp. XENO-1]|uniref:phosphopantetheine-binding protein n=1 Tax=Xenorhabdus bovienii TaxID=40576 RepID=UPI0020CA5C7F|nr:phosphopantetheine-binding protein [Xenorhabdus bovienii]MCP9267801.1 phosphopantetheine-binding protein [Xenorhabdus bovienii subsp. africana]